jgi:tetratricopeptide (TPR) repeat protein
MFSDNKKRRTMSLSSISASIASNADAVFSATTPAQDQVDGLANSALSRGLTDITNGNLDAAIVELKGSIALSPYSDNSLTTYKYLADTYQKQGKDDEAIKAYQQAAGFFPTSDVPLSALGLIYFNQKDFKDADKEYSKAVALNPNLASNVYSLGETYIAEGRYTDAETEFKRVKLLTGSNDPSGFYALGQDYRKMGQYDEAAAQLTQAVQLDKTYSDAYLELGKTYADMKKPDKANDQVSILSNLAKTQSNTQSQSTVQSQVTELQDYISNAAAPKFIAAYSSGGFLPVFGPGTLVSSMNSDLSNPDSSKTFTMNFTFSKAMDAESVQNISNWVIRRTSGSDSGGAYNWGIPTKPSEASISSVPLSVTYNSKTNTASVMFRITQNSDANATLDPSHIMFKFSGKDASGNSMDHSADQYNGVSKIV